MRHFVLIIICISFSTALASQGNNEDSRFKDSPDLSIKNTSVVYDDRLDLLIMSIEVEGEAGETVPKGVGQIDGAPVLGYVFPTSLKPTDVGFGETEGIVAMALTSHPDFDDTPLWDEDNDSNYDNDGVVWHPHWVVLNQDKRVAGGLSVKQFDPEKDKVQLPPTNPGMPMYMDSPGYSTLTKGNIIRVIIPAYRIKNQISFSFDAVSAYMQVNASNPNMPMLGVYTVYSVASGDLSLPYIVAR